MPMPLFPEATGFVGECLMPVGIMPEDSITVIYMDITGLRM